MNNTPNEKSLEAGELLLSDVEELVSQVCTTMMLYQMQASIKMRQTNQEPTRNEASSVFESVKAVAVMFLEGRGYKINKGAVQ